MSGPALPARIVRRSRDGRVVLDGGLDCSDATQLWRAGKLKELMEKKYSAVSSLGDRGRSVNYVSPADLQALIDDLRGDMAACENVPPKPIFKVFQVPYSKWR